MSLVLSNYKLNFLNPQLFISPLHFLTFLIEHKWQMFRNQWKVILRMKKYLLISFSISCIFYTWYSSDAKLQSISSIFFNFWYTFQNIVLTFNFSVPWNSSFRLTIEIRVILFWLNISLHIYQNLCTRFVTDIQYE